MLGARFHPSAFGLFSTLLITDVSKNDKGNITCVGKERNITINLEGTLAEIFFCFNGSQKTCGFKCYSVKRKIELRSDPHAYLDNTVGHFRVHVCLLFKASLSTKFFL